MMSHMSLRIYIMLLIFLGGFVYVAISMYKLQIVRHEELFEKAKEKYTKEVVRKGVRGEIFDRNGNLLVCNIPVRNLAADPQVAGDKAECFRIARLLAPELGLREAFIYKRLMMKEFESTNKDGVTTKRPCRYVMLQRGIELDASEKLKALIKKEKIKGMIMEDTWRRSYPKGEMLANFLGATSMERDEVVPLFGLEKSMEEKIMSGESHLKYERSRDGKRISYGNMEGDPVKDGCDIYLTIQEPIQAIMEEEMDKFMEQIKPKAAYAIMVDPYTGDIMAVSQRPTYNPNDRSVLHDDPQAARNRIAEDCFEPGSVMKPFVISMAMDWNIVTPDTMIDCTDGVWYYAKRSLRDSHKVGVVPVTQVIAQSSNIGTAKIALMMGEKRLDEVLTTFGFKRTTGLPIHPETKGQIRPLHKWDGLSITRFCIGQGINVSFLQLARAYCMLANGGYPINLRIVDRIDRDGITEKYPYYRGECIFKRADTWDRIRKMMIEVTMGYRGTARAYAAIPGYYVAGKTGTAQKFMNGAYSDKYFASFVGFLPSNKPRFVLLVMADEPTGKKDSGAAASAPVFKAIAERTLRYMHEPYEVPLEEWNAKIKAAKQEEREFWRREDEKTRKRREALKRKSAR